MPALQKNEAASADDAAFDQIPIQKTNPLVFVAVGVVVLVLGGVGAYTLLGRSKNDTPKQDMAAALHSASVAATEAKAKQEEREKHLELAAKAWAAASEKERAAAAAAAAAEEETKDGANKSSSARTGSGAARRPSPKGPSGNDLNELDKLGSEVNSELGK